MKTPYFLVSDGELTLQLWPAEEGGYDVTCPWDPSLITQAESVEDAFDMAYDAQQALREAREKLHSLAPHGALTDADQPGSSPRPAPETSPAGPASSSG